MSNRSLLHLPANGLAETSGGPKSVPRSTSARQRARAMLWRRTSIMIACVRWGSVIGGMPRPPPGGGCGILMSGAANFFKARLRAHNAASWQMIG